MAKNKSIILESKDPDKIFSTLLELDERQKARLREGFSAYVANEDNLGQKPVRMMRVPYAQLSIETDIRIPPLDARSPGWYLPRPGVYHGSATQIGMLERYFRRNIEGIIKNTNLPLCISLSDQLIPVHFAFGETKEEFAARLNPRTRDLLSSYFPVPDPRDINDDILRGKFVTTARDRFPLLPFTAIRTDEAAATLPHYLGSGAEHIQSNIIFTNYPMYEELFRARAMEIMSGTDDREQAAYRSRFTEFVEPGGRTHYNQNISAKEAVGTYNRERYDSPAYHLKDADGRGITLINVHQGPSNALKIAELLAPIRREAPLWVMLGHCGGLRDTMKHGDFVIANGYVLDAGILNGYHPHSADVGNQPEVYGLLRDAIMEEFNIPDIRSRALTGLVMTTENRMWAHNAEKYWPLIYQSHALGVDMESGVLAAAAKSYGIAFGAFLCVSDLPILGMPKLPGDADLFYQGNKVSHFNIVFRGCENAYKHPGLESRQLRPPIFAAPFL